MILTIRIWKQWRWRMLDKMLRDLVHCEFQIGKFTFAFLDVLLAVCITFVAVQIRMPVFGAAKITGPATGSFQLLCLCLDFVLAVLMAVFTWNVTKSKVKATGIYALAVIWPVFAGNSALNGGYEVVGAVILLALLAVTAIRGSYTYPAFWALTALTCGFQILQSDGMGEKLTNCWPNVYTLFSETGFLAEYGYAGKIFVIGVLLMGLYYISKLEFQVTPKLLVLSGLFFSLFVTLFYPFMNYRSGFLANVFALLLFMMDKKKCYVPMFLCIISYVSFSLFHNGEIGIYYWIYALGVLALTMDAGTALFKELHAGKNV